MRAKACVRCKEYAVIHTDNPISQQNIKKFEKIHLGHSVLTIDYFEIKDQYKRFDPNQKVDTLKKSVVV